MQFFFFVSLSYLGTCKETLINGEGGGNFATVLLLLLEVV